MEDCKMQKGKLNVIKRPQHQKEWRRSSSYLAHEENDYYFPLGRSTV
jgi:hypothetical protein